MPKNRWRATAALGVSALLVSACTAATSQTTGSAHPAPAGPVLIDVGSADALAPWRGKVVLVSFWASWCGPCMTELPHLDRLHDRASAFGAAVVGVNVDKARPAARRVAKALKLSFPLLYDGRVKQLSRRFRPPGLPYAVLLDKFGHIRAIITGALNARSVATVERTMRELATADAGEARGGAIAQGLAQ